MNTKQNNSNQSQEIFLNSRSAMGSSSVEGALLQAMALSADMSSLDIEPARRRAAAMAAILREDARDDDVIEAIQGIIRGHWSPGGKWGHNLPTAKISTRFMPSVGDILIVVRQIKRFRNNPGAKNVAMSLSAI